jgi:predicted nucleic acid-binding protein
LKLCGASLGLGVAVWRYNTAPCRVSLTTLAIDAEVGRRAGEYLRQFAKSHRVELGDALIEATAASHKVELWTRNRRHYPEKDVEFY